MTEREKLIEIIRTELAQGCMARECIDCRLRRIAYPRCRATYMADRIIEALEGEKNDRA